MERERQIGRDYDFHFSKIWRRREILGGELGFWGDQRGIEREIQRSRARESYPAGKIVGEDKSRLRHGGRAVPVQFFCEGDVVRC